LAELPGVFGRQIFDNKTIRAAELRIANDQGSRITLRWVWRKVRIQRGVVGWETRRIGEDARRGVEAVEILRRPEEITIVSRIGIQSQRGCDAPVSVKFECIVFRFIDRINRRLNVPKICRLLGLRIWIYTQVEISYVSDTG